MGNLFVTKLKGAVDNDSYLKVGEVLIDVGNRIGSQDVPANRKITMTFKGTNKTLRCIEGNFVDANDQNIGTTLTIAQNTKTDFYAVKNAKIVVDLHDLMYIDMSNCRSGSIDITRLGYGNVTAFYDMFLPYGAYGDIFGLAPLVNMRYVNFWMAPKVTGDIKHLANCNPNIFTAGGSGIYGDLSSVINWTNCTMEVPASVTYTQATYNTMVANGCTISGGTVIQ